MFDSVFHGAPSSVGGQSSPSGQASLAIDVVSGILYFRTPANGGWSQVSGSGGGGSGVPNNPAAIRTVTSNTTPTLADGTLLCNGTFTVTLLTTLPSGTTFRIKNIGAGPITISSSVNIDFATTFVLNPYPGSSVDVQYDGSQWWIL